MKVMLRLDVTPEQAEALAKEWLHDMERTPITITLPSQDMTFDAALTYVKENA